MLGETDSQLEDDEELPALEEPVAKVTIGQGDCAFHALLGVSSGGPYYCADVTKKRKEVYDALTADDMSAELKIAVICSIRSLVMDGRIDIISRVGKHSLKLFRDYKAFEATDGDRAKSAWLQFETMLKRFGSVKAFIDERSPLGKKPTVRNLREQFYDVLSQTDDSLKKTINSIPDLHQAYRVYQEAHSAIFPWEARVSSCIREYASYIRRDGQWLLFSDLAILAVVFKKRVIYYATLASAPDTINPSATEEVIISFNGIDHYERVIYEPVSYHALILPKQKPSSLLPTATVRMTDTQVLAETKLASTILPPKLSTVSGDLETPSYTASSVMITPEIPIQLTQPDLIALSNPLHQKLRRGILALLQRFNAEKELFEGELLQCYVPLSGYLPHQNRHVDDISAPAHQWIKEGHGKGNGASLVVTGLSGSGKTLWGQQLVLSLWHSEFANTTIPLWIPLLSIRDPFQSLLRSYLIWLNEEQCFGPGESLTDAEIAKILDTPLLLVLDGYDELSTHVNLYTTNGFNSNPNIQAIFTCRTEAKPEYLNRFGANHSTFTVTEYRLNALRHDRTHSQISEYIQKFVTYRALAKTSVSSSHEGTASEAWNLETYLRHIQAIPELDELISNPFTLAIVVHELPMIVAEQSQEEAGPAVIAQTRYKIYDIFLERWFARRADKLLKQSNSDTHQIIDTLTRESQGKALPKILRDYTQGLAIDMFKYHTNDIHLPSASAVTTTGATKLWQAKWLDVLQSESISDKQLRLLRQNSLLMPLGGHHYTFLHESLRTFFAAKHLFSGALVDAWIRCDKNLNVSGLLEQSEEFSFLVDQVRQSKDFEQALWQVIDLSRSEPSVWRASANAISLLNAAGISFSGKDLSRIRIGGDERWGANLSYALLDSANLAYADLRYANLSGARLSNANFTGACLDNVQWGERPDWNLSKAIAGEIVIVTPNLQYIITKSVQHFVISDDQIAYTVYELIKGKPIKRYSITDKEGYASLIFDKITNRLILPMQSFINIYDIKCGKLLHKININISYLNDFVISMRGFVIDDKHDIVHVRYCFSHNDFYVYLRGVATISRKTNDMKTLNATIYIYTLDNGKHCNVFSEILIKPTSMPVFSQDNKWLFLIVDKQLHAWRMNISYQEGKMALVKDLTLEITSPEDGNVRMYTMTQDDNFYYIVITYDKKIIHYTYALIRDVEAENYNLIQYESKELMSYELVQDITYAGCFSHNRRWFASVANSKIIIWDIESGLVFNIYYANTNAISELKFTVDDDTLYYIYENKIIKFWHFLNTSHQKKIETFLRPLDFDISENAQLIATSSYNGIVINDLHSKTKLFKYHTENINIKYIAFKKTQVTLMIFYLWIIITLFTPLKIMRYK